MDNMIDFPCAPCWVRHYAERGLTPDYPSDYYEPSRADLLERIEQLEAGLKAKKVTIKYYQPVIAKPETKGTSKYTGFDV